MEDMFDDLKALIDYIQSVYSSTTAQWMNCASTKVNLKKLTISNIDTNENIYKSIMEYTQFLNERSADILMRLSSICACKVTARVKAPNSIEYKIHNYKNNKQEKGKVPICKCLNDLFGFRIILDFPLTYCQIHTFVEDIYHGKYRCINSSKGDYKAVHLYFKENNEVFQWELQIWNDCDTEGNFASHKKYKQEYTTWEKESEEGGILDD